MDELMQKQARDLARANGFEMPVSQFQNGVDPVAYMFHKNGWIGQRVVMLCGRYIWRGRVKEVCEPMIFLTEARQVTDHGREEEREGLDVGDAMVTIMAVESIYTEDQATWIN